MNPLKVLEARGARLRQSLKIREAQGLQARGLVDFRSFELLGLRNLQPRGPPGLENYRLVMLRVSGLVDFKAQGLVRLRIRRIVSSKTLELMRS